MDDDELELLRRFASTGDQKAFEALVERHAGLVRGVALRRLSDPHLAEEVTQSVFVLLARKAGGIRECLGGWLYKAAFLEAGNALRKSERYRRKLDQWRNNMETDDPPRPDGECGWDEVRPHLDEAVAGLEPRSRNLLILWFYERRSLREIAAATGKSEEANRKAISRCVRKLADRLRRRGISATTAGLAAVLSAQTLCAPPASAAALAAAALGTASAAATTAGAAAAGAAASGPAVIFSQTVITLMKTSQVIKVTGLALLLAAVPTVYYQQRNSALESEVVSLRKALQEVSAKTSLTSAIQAPATQGAVAASDTEKRKNAPGPAAADASAPPNPGAFILDALKNRAAPDAERDLTRMSLYLPDLTDDQKTRIRSLLEKRHQQNADNFAKALKSGLMAKMASDPKSLTEAEKAELQTAAPKEAAPEQDPLKEILTEEQFAKHLEAKQQKRVNDAESVASDSLKKLGEAFDLSEEQKDSIFQAVAQHELSQESSSGDGPAGALDPRAMAEERDRIIREQLSEQQAVLFDAKRQEDRERWSGFIRMMSGNQAAHPAKGGE